MARKWRRQLTQPATPTPCRTSGPEEAARSTPTTCRTSGPAGPARPTPTPCRSSTVHYQIVDKFEEDFAKSFEVAVESPS